MADLILASHFSRDTSEMGFSEKFRRFDKLLRLNEKTATNTLHISLNFSPDDHLETETMQRVAADYMTRIGFGDQPFLVYQHHDTTHPHVHIITTNVKANGKAIYLHNIGKKLSEPARKQIELEYGLIKAERKRKEESVSLQAIALRGAQYGRSETKRLISNILVNVISSYKFASLEEFNAILKQFNVFADGGTPGSRMHENRGLMYSLLDAEGFKIDVAIKAS